MTKVTKKISDFQRHRESHQTLINQEQEERLQRNLKHKGVCKQTNQNGRSMSAEKAKVPGFDGNAESFDPWEIQWNLFAEVENLNVA